jgi:hypothetical protein
VLLQLTPNALPAARYVATRDVGDDSPIEYVQVSQVQALFDLKRGE